MSLHQKYELVREQIRHEDGLINNRTTWFLVFQALLFGAFFDALGLFERLSDFQDKLLVVALSVLGALGAVSALVAASAVHAAHEHIGSLRTWWQKQQGTEKDALPPLMGTQGIFLLRGLRLSGATFLSGAAGVWGVLVVLLVWGALE